MPVKSTFFVLPDDVKDHFRIKHIKIDLQQFLLIAAYQHKDADKEHISFTVRKKMWYSNDRLKHNINITPAKNMYISDPTTKAINEILTDFFVQAALLSSEKGSYLKDLTVEEPE